MSSKQYSVEEKLDLVLAALRNEASKAAREVLQSQAPTDAHGATAEGGQSQQF